MVFWKGFGDCFGRYFGKYFGIVFKWFWGIHCKGFWNCKRFWDCFQSGFGYSLQRILGLICK